MKNILIGKRWKPPKGCEVYKLRFLGTDKVYIGSTKNLYSRYGQHKGSFKRYTPFQKDYEWVRAYNTYKNFIMEVIEYCTESKLGKTEQYYINEFLLCNSRDKLLNSQLTVNRI